MRQPVQYAPKSQVDELKKTISDLAERISSLEDMKHRTDGYIEWFRQDTLNDYPEKCLLIGLDKYLYTRCGTKPGDKIKVACGDKSVEATLREHDDNAQEEFPIRYTRKKHCIQLSGYLRRMLRIKDKSIIEYELKPKTIVLYCKE